MGIDELKADGESLGAAVIVRGVVVAWFATFDEAAEDWCRENHFGEWLTWRAKAPEIVPPTEDEYERLIDTALGRLAAVDKAASTN
jgi:hypothetical protein